MSLDLAALLERVEAASGPDRELDADITDLLNPLGATWRRNPPGEYVYTYVDKLGWGKNPEPYTASLDAALALCERVLPGVWRDISGPNPNIAPHKGKPFVVTIECGGPRKRVSAWGTSEALALLSALLKALRSTGRES